MSRRAMMSRRGPETTTRRPEVTIEVDGPLAKLDPVPFALPDDVLYREVRRYEAGGPRGIEAVTRRSPIHHAAPGGGLTFLAGFAPRVVGLLGSRGLDVEVVDRTPRRPRVAIDEAGMGRLTPEGAEFARLVAARSRMQVAVPGGHRRIALIAALARAMPEARISVTTASRRQAAAIRGRLQARLEGGVSLYHKHGVILSAARVQVCTSGSLDEPGSDVVVFFEASDVTAARYLRSFGEFGDRRVVAFFDPASRVGGSERLLREGLLGPAIDPPCDPSRRRAEVRVARVDRPPIARRAGLGGLEAKRQATWLNGPRNRAIAEIAGAFAIGRRDVLTRHGLGPDAMVAGDDGVSPRVAVLVESPEHGRALRRLLRGWSLIDGRSEGDGTSRKPGEDAQGLPRRSILTHVRAARMADLGVDVLIRADANRWSPELPGFPPRATGGRSVLLVRLGDEGEEDEAGSGRRPSGDGRRRDRDRGRAPRRARRP